MKSLLLSLFFLSPLLHSQFLSVEVSSADWGLKNFSDIRYGQIAILHEPGGDRLTVYTLRDGLPKVESFIATASSPTFSGNCFLVSDFNGGMRNVLGGSFNVFQRSPSSAFVEYAADIEDRKSLRLSYSKERDGFCGLWIHLFNTTSTASERMYLDASEFSAITFWVRGSTGKETLSIKIADAAWERKEDALEVGDLGRFLPSGTIDTNWRQAVISFSQIPARINKSLLATISFEASSVHQGSVYLKSLSFCRDTTSFLPLPPLAPVTQLCKNDHAVWVWNTDDLVRDKAKRNQLVGLLSQEKVSHVFLAVPYRPQAQRERGIEIEAKIMRPLVFELKAKGITVHALFGDKDFILPEQRRFVNTTLENVLRYNSTSKKQERFDGIHFDVEPYLLAGFNGPRGTWILQNFLRLLSEAATTAKRGKLLMGADIPFWLDTPEEFSREQRTIEFAGISKPVHEHIIDLMDIVVLMSYRTFAAGADGIVLHSSDELEYASKKGTRVFVGLETSPLPDENILTIRGTPTEGATPPGSAHYVALVPRLDSAKVFVVKSTDKARFDVFMMDSGVNLGQVLWWPVLQDLFVPGTKVSFATLDTTRMRNAMRQTVSELSAYPAFEGIAIHHAESYQRLLNRP
ncbi:MAG: hypothetical protein HYY49_10970 [Ignavibacteriales bacterium]|nr:hypothetical protein [Ignavibacteriales bacterium]